MKQRVGRIGTGDGDALRRQLGDGGRDDVHLLAPIRPPSPACGLSPATAMRGWGMPKSSIKRRCGDADGLHDQLAWTARGDRGQRDMHGGRHNLELVGHQHHDRADRGRSVPRRQGPGKRCGRDTRGPVAWQGFLGDRVGDERQRLAGQRRLRSRFSMAATMAASSAARRGAAAAAPTGSASAKASPASGSALDGDSDRRYPSQSARARCAALRVAVDGKGRQRSRSARASSPA